jgi:hypothetical protein
MMTVIVGVPLLVFLVPLCLVIGFRNTRGWWIPGAATFAAGLVTAILIGASQTPHHGGDLPLIDLAGLVSVLGAFCMVCGLLCFLTGAAISGAGRRARRSDVLPPDDLPPAYMVSRPYVVDRPQVVDRPHVVDRPQP